MKKLFVLAFLSGSAFASNPDIEACLKAWGKHPFKDNGERHRTLKGNVKVMGVGGNIKDNEATSTPELTLVKHSVAVMSKQTYELLNPNGWYCIKGSVTVMGKSEIKIHCKAHLASSDGGVTIGGSNDETNGVTVFGAVRVERVGCTNQKQEENL